MSVLDELMRDIEAAHAAKAARLVVGATCRIVIDGECSTEGAGPDSAAVEHGIRHLGLLDGRICTITEMLHGAGDHPYLVRAPFVYEGEMYTGDNFSADELELIEEADYISGFDPGAPEGSYTVMQRGP